MARGFGTTLGIGTTDAITTGLTDTAQIRTYSIWANRNGGGGSNAGRLWDKRTGATSEISLFNSEANSQYRLNPSFTSAPQFSFPFPSASVWHHILVMYNSGSISNLPIAYVDGVLQTVTTQIAGSGSYISNSDPFVIGNTVGVRVWDGMLAEFAVWNRFLSPQEVSLLFNGQSPERFPAGLAEYVPLDVGPLVSRLRRLRPTQTGTKPQPHPRRIIGPSRSRTFVIKDARLITPSVNSISLSGEAGRMDLGIPTQTTLKI